MAKKTAAQRHVEAHKARRQARIDKRPFKPTLDEDHHTLWNALVEACYLLDANRHTSDDEAAIWDFQNRVRTNKHTARIQREIIKSNASFAAPLSPHRSEPQPS